MLGTAHPRRTALLLFCLAIGTTAGLLGWHYVARPVVVLGPMLQQVTTDGFALFCRVHGRGRLRARLVHADQVHPDGLVSTQANNDYLVTFGDLIPDHSYQYELELGGRPLCRHAVRTAPAADRAFRFLALGDTGVGNRHQYAVARHMRSWRPDLIIHTGDLIYPRGRPEDNYRKFFQPYAALLAEVPLYACLGNHEFKVPGIEPVAACFVFPPNGPAGAPAEHNYWFDYAQARFVAIDSNDDEPFFRDVTSPWLDDVLESAGNRWKIVFFHEPVYTHGRYSPAVKLLNTIVPVLEQHRTHLVLCGHNHMYERTHPIRDGRKVGAGEGTVYVTTGAGGANLYEARLPMPEQIAAWNDREHSFTVVDVTPDVLRLRQIGETGRLIDESYLPRTRPMAAGDYTRSSPASSKQESQRRFQSDVN